MSRLSPSAAHRLFPTTPEYLTLAGAGLLLRDTRLILGDPPVVVEEEQMVLIDGEENAAIRN